MHWLWLVPAFPLFGYALLALAGGRISQRAVAAVGAGSVGLSALLAWLIAIRFVASPPMGPGGEAYRQVLWTWIEVTGFADFKPVVMLYLDPLAVVMMLVVTSVGFLIHLYSTEFMAAEEGYARYFAYLNLFVAAMLVLVLAGDLLLLFLGWEAVGLCSYLLIGFWYRDPANGSAARKAFIVTRAGDTGLLLGLLLLFTALGTSDIQALLGAAYSQWPVGSALATAAAALVLVGALGKSAQLPLQTWLPDAMAGPTPVSALIHAATMVTAGVYLIARLHVLFELAPAVRTAIAVIGALTLLLAGLSALAQHDIKRVLAYSTISQIGYMFLALGVGAWTAAIFHFMTHAFFKALLFLAAGAVIHALNGEHDIFRMGGLRRQMPLVFWSFAVGGASLAALPLVTAGFFSKDLILWQTWSAPTGGGWLWAAGWVGALLTSLYIFRLVFLVFFGLTTTPARRPFGWRMRLPLLVLGALSVIGGYVETPPFVGRIHLFSGFLAPVFPGAGEPAGEAGSELALGLLASVASLAGIVAAWWLFLRRRALAARIAATPAGRALQAWWEADWGFDFLYDRLFVRPYYALAAFNRDDLFDALYAVLAELTRHFHRQFSRSQTGRLRWYAAGVTAGAVLFVGLAVWL
jgi:NADH-quinone oxidoreductase subunit L